MSEPSMQVPVSLIERMREAHGGPDLDDAAGAVIELLPDSYTSARRAGELNVQVPAGLVRSAAALLELAGRGNTAGDLLALLSQPTPTAEPCSDGCECEMAAEPLRIEDIKADAWDEGYLLATGGMAHDLNPYWDTRQTTQPGVTEDEVMRRVDASVGKSPRIEDPAPVTTFIETDDQRRIREALRIDADYRRLHARGRADAIVRALTRDPSTTRDVTPPPERELCPACDFDPMAPHNGHGDGCKPEGNL